MNRSIKFSYWIKIIRYKSIKFMSIQKFCIMSTKVETPEPFCYYPSIGFRLTIFISAHKKLSQSSTIPTKENSKHNKKNHTTNNKKIVAKRIR